MKKILPLLTLAILSFGLIAFDAEAARRFGGGKSIGKQRESISPQAAPKPAPTAAPAAASAPPTAAPASGASKWLGPLAGLAAGGLLASLFMGGAFSGIKMMDVLLLAALIGAAFFIFRMLRKPQPEQPLTQPMQYSGMGQNTSSGIEPMVAGAATSGSAPAPANIPADFQVEPFLRNAKISFLRLQAANDTRDVNDIREYTTSEMFAEISMQISERGNEPQKTEVVTVNAELLEVVVTDDLAIASVRFTGQLRDLLNNAPGAALEAFDEIWHVQKNPKDPKSVWLLAGIQQVS